MRILVVDDLKSKREYLADCARAMRPSSEVIEAASSREAFRIMELLGKDGIQAGIIDFDLCDGFDGGDVIGRLKRENPFADITLATARSGACFEEEAKPIALEAGADEALSTEQEDFERRLSSVLSLAA